MWRNCAFQDSANDFCDSDGDFRGSENGFAIVKKNLRQMWRKLYFHDTARNFRHSDQNFSGSKKFRECEIFSAVNAMEIVLFTTPPATSAIKIGIFADQNFLSRMWNLFHKKCDRNCAFQYSTCKVGNSDRDSPRSLNIFVVMHNHTLHYSGRKVELQWNRNKHTMFNAQGMASAAPPSSIS